MSSTTAYLQEDADEEIGIDHHEYFLQLGETFAERVRKFMQNEELYRKRYSLIVEWV